MTLRTTAVLAAAVLAAAVPCALAQEAAKAKAPEMAKPAPEMAQLAFFNGHWTCEGSMQPSPFGPGGKTTSTVKIHDELGGFWQSGKVRSSGAGMPELEGMFHTTYDPAAKQYVMLWVDNTGAWAKSTSGGWQGDTISYEGEMSMGGQKMMGRDIFVKGANGSMKHSFEMQMHGKWAPMGDETCHKGAEKK